MPCIFYINTSKHYTQKHRKYIKYSIFHDLIEIYSFVSPDNFLFIMLEKCFSIASTSFLSISIISRHILNALVVEADLQLCGVKFSIELVCANVSLINPRRVSVETV